MDCLYTNNFVSQNLIKYFSNNRLTCEKSNFFFCAIEFLENVTMHRNFLKFPSDEDLNGAAVALTRLQDTYKLDTAEIARGEINGIKYRWNI